MKIKEIKTMPNPNGFGWGEYSRVRELAPAEAMPDEAESTPDSETETGWVLVSSRVKELNSAPAVAGSPSSAVQISAPATSGGNE